MTERTSYCGYLGITVLHRLDSKPFDREVAQEIKTNCQLDVFLSGTLGNQATIILASKHGAWATLEEVELYLDGVTVQVSHYHGGLYNPTMPCETREFDELDD